MNKAQKAAKILLGEVEAWAYPSSFYMDTTDGRYYYIVPVWEHGRIKWYTIADKGVQAPVYQDTETFQYYFNGHKRGPLYRWSGDRWVDVI